MKIFANQAPARQSQVRLDASIEITARQVNDMPELRGMFPLRTRVYIPDLGTEAECDIISAARKVHLAGYVAVPHIAARRLVSHSQLQARLRRLADEAVHDLLIIGGGADRPAGPFKETMAVLETGLLAELGIPDVGIAGHPEGSPDFTAEEAQSALLRKLEFGRAAGLSMRIVTQFGFDGEGFAQWAERLNAQGIVAPIHLGIAGPAKLTTLLKYAAACGVGNSLSFLRKRGSAIFDLAHRQSPEDVIGPIERVAPDTSITQLHVFPFGGVKSATEWLRERGSWSGV